MLWEVSTQKGLLSLTVHDLYANLASAVVKNKKEEHIKITQAFIESLEVNSSLHELSLLEISVMSFQFGYYYRVFLEKNDVEVVDDETSSDEDVASEVEE